MIFDDTRDVADLDVFAATFHVQWHLGKIIGGDDRQHVAYR